MAADTIRVVIEEAQHEASSQAIFPDHRLKLLFVCAYEGLLRCAPTIGAHVGYAAALAEARGAEAGLAVLEAIPPESVGTYQPYWALSAHLLMSTPGSGRIACCGDPRARLGS